MCVPFRFLSIGDVIGIKTDTGKLAYDRSHDYHMTMQGRCTTR